MPLPSLSHIYKRYRSLKTGRITALPVILLMPHSACNCRCVMCDIWKGNQDLQQLKEDDLKEIIRSLKKLDTKQVVFSGGEALLHPAFFRFCALLKKEKIKISLLSTGITLKKNAAELVEWVNDIIVSLDGDETTHDSIRNIPGAYHKLAEGIAAITAIKPGYKITGRTVIHRQNFHIWPQIIECAKTIGLKQISFLAADISSHAFNRQIAWDEQRQQQILPGKNELPLFKTILGKILNIYHNELGGGFISESPEKLENIYGHYAAFYGLNNFPFKKCNAPWVSAVLEADGTVRPCFFHEPYGNIKNNVFDKVINNENAINFRKQLNVATNDTCLKCVCALNLSPQTAV